MTFLKEFAWKLLTHSDSKGFVDPIQKPTAPAHLIQSFFLGHAACKIVSLIYLLY